MDIEKKIGQMIMLGFRGTEIKEGDTIAEDLRKGRCGSVILFDTDPASGADKRNIESPEQLKKLCSDITRYSEIRPLIAVDREGGKVDRLKEKYGFPKTVSQKYLGDMDDENLTRKYAAENAATLKEVGINLNLAPSADLAINPAGPTGAGKDRCFSDDYRLAEKHCRYVIQEHRKMGILCSPKHFPGHGSAVDDSHLGFTDVTGTWKEYELFPFNGLIGSDDADLIMTAHIFNSKIDRNFPATLSKKTICGLLRGKLDFKGPVLTDDMSMKAISANYGIKQAIAGAVNAGCDILMFANTLQYDENIASKAIEIIKSLIREGKLSEIRIDDSYRRIMDVKSKLQ